MKMAAEERTEQKVRGDEEKKQQMICVLSPVQKTRQMIYVCIYSVNCCRWLVDHLLIPIFKLLLLDAAIV